MSYLNVIYSTHNQFSHTYYLLCSHHVSNLNFETKDFTPQKVRWPPLRRVPFFLPFFFGGFCTSFFCFLEMKGSFQIVRYPPMVKSTSTSTPRTLRLKAAAINYKFMVVIYAHFSFSMSLFYQKHVRSGKLT